MAIINTNTTCLSDNVASTDQTAFFSSDGVNWDAHRIGWAIAGGCALITVVISAINITSHARKYVCPAEQRQILRILYMPPVYAIISFLSYRFFRSYTYYDLVETVYEAITISAFMLLLIEYVAATATGHDARNAISRKDKRALPIPLCCWRYRPTKAYFMYTIKWSVMQYVVVRPLCSIIGIITQALGVLCESGGLNFRFAYVYIEIAETISITIALYGLFVFYGLTKEELVGRRPLAKFMAIKLIVMFTFYQGFVFSILENRVIKPTDFWTTTNIADGLNALAICIEMVFFAAFMWWAYPVSEYNNRPGKRRSAWRALVDSINYTDFALEIWDSLKFFLGAMRGQSYGHSVNYTDDTLDSKGYASERPRADFGAAFGVSYGNSNGASTPGPTVPAGRFRHNARPSRDDGPGSFPDRDFRDRDQERAYRQDQERGLGGSGYANDDEGSDDIRLTASYPTDPRRSNSTEALITADTRRGMNESESESYGMAPLRLGTGNANSRRGDGSGEGKERPMSPPGKVGQAF